MGNVSKIKKGIKVKKDLTKEEESFWDNLAIEYSTRRFYMLNYSKKDLETYHQAISTNYERNAKRWNKKNPDKEQKLFGPALLDTLPCHCQEFEGDEGKIKIECPICELKRLRLEDDMELIEERKAQIRARRKR